MGSVKALLPWQGTTLITYLVSLYLEVPGHVVVVTGHARDKIEDALETAGLLGHANLKVVHNANYAMGRSKSIRVGLRAAPRARGYIIGSVDQPVSRHVLMALNAAAGTGLVVSPTYDGKSGHPVLFDASLLTELMQIDEATQGLRAVVRRHGGKRTFVPADSPMIFSNLNTPESYDRAFKRWGDVRLMPEKGVRGTLS